MLNGCCLRGQNVERMNSQPKDQAPKVRAEENSFSTGPKVFDKLQLLAEVARNMDPRYANQQTDAKKTRNIQVNKEIKTIASSTIMKGEKAPTNGNVKSLRDAVTFLKTMELTSSNFLLPGMKVNKLVFFFRHYNLWF